MYSSVLYEALSHHFSRFISLCLTSWWEGSGQEHGLWSQIALVSGASIYELCHLEQLVQPL